MHKLTARIIQCIVPHKLIVLDLLNFCYHKLHVQFHRGVLSRVSACQYLLPLTFRAVCLNQSSPKFAVQVLVLTVILASACKLPLCWTHPALKSIPNSLRVYSKWPWINNHGLSGIFKQLWWIPVINYNTFNNVVLQFVFVRINQVYLYCCSYRFKICCE